VNSAIMAKEQVTPNKSGGTLGAVEGPLLGMRALMARPVLGSRKGSVAVTTFVLFDLFSWGDGVG
jgi:hypothetical protein